MVQRDKLGRFVKGIHPKTEFKKGNVPLHPFKKGHTPWWVQRGLPNPALPKHSGQFKRDHTPWNKGSKGMHLSKKTEFKKGEKHVFWKGGTSSEPYSFEFRELKKQIRKRDNYRCQQCFRHQSELNYPVHVHHIDFNKENDNPDNLVTLCKNCHSQTNFNRQDWINYFQNRLGGKI